MLHAHPDPDTQYRQHQAQRAARGPQQEKTQHGKDRGHAVQDSDHLPLRKASLQKFVMDVLAVSAEYRPATDETANHRKRRLQDGKPERNDRNGDSDDGGGLLHALQRQRAEHESHKQAAAVSQKDGRRIEVVAEKTQDSAGQYQRHDRHERRMAEERNHEDDQRGKQRGSGGQSVQSVDQVEGVGDTEDPQDRERQADEPRKMVSAEQDRQVENAKAAREQKGASQHLNQKFKVRSHRMQVVV